MRGSKAKTLSSLFSSSLKVSPKPNLKTLDAIAELDRASSTNAALQASSLNLFVSKTSLVKKKKSKNKSKIKSEKKEVQSSELTSLSGFALSGLKPKPRFDSDLVEESLPWAESNEGGHLTNKISSLLISDALEELDNLEEVGEEGEKEEEAAEEDGKVEEEDDEEEVEEEEDEEDVMEDIVETLNPFQGDLNIPWISSLTHHEVSLRRKEVVRDKKLSWMFSTSQGGRYDRLVNMCAKKVGTETAFDLFGKLGRATGVDEYNTLLKVCVETAKAGNSETILLEQMNRAFLYFKSMKEHGFQLEEETYGQFMSFIVELAMVQEFYFFADVIKDVNPNASGKLGYYEMLLWIEVDDEEKIQALCHHMTTEECGKDLRENYLLALCEGGREKELLQIFGAMDIKNFASTGSLEAVFKSLGKLKWDALVEKFIISFKDRGIANDDLSCLICSHVIGNSSLVGEDLILSFNDWHTKMEVKPSSASYEKLIQHFCAISEVETALDLFDEIFTSGLTVSMETIHHILQTCEAAYDYNLVHRVYSAILDHNLEADVETFTLMINCCVKMKNMEAAYNMLKRMEEIELAPTSTIYNIMLASCLKEKNHFGVKNVIKQMQKADILPDSSTFSHLIRQCVTEKEIDQYWELLQNSDIQATASVYMSLIQAYVSCGHLEKAKSVLADKLIPGKDFYRVKSAVVQALASNGKIAEALELFKEIKESGHHIGVITAFTLMDHYDLVESDTLLELLEELHVPEQWLDGCSRVIMNCIRRKDMSTITDLLKQLKDKISVDDELVLEAILVEIFCVIGDTDGAHLETGLELLCIVKDDLGLRPPRKCLDFLLHASVAAKNMKSSKAIWKEYAAAGLPHNAISCLRMYQGLLAVGDHTSANKLFMKIPKDDPHVRCVLKACQVTFVDSLTKKKMMKPYRTYESSIVKSVAQTTNNNDKKKKKKKKRRQKRETATTLVD